MEAFDNSSSSLASAATAASAVSDVSAASGQSSLSVAPSESPLLLSLASQVRRHNQMYKVDLMGQFLDSELKNCTYTDVHDLPTTLFPHSYLSVALNDKNIPRIFSDSLKIKPAFLKPFFPGGKLYRDPQHADQEVVTVSAAKTHTQTQTTQPITRGALLRAKQEAVANIGNDFEDLENFEDDLNDFDNFDDLDDISDDDPSGDYVSEGEVKRQAKKLLQQLQQKPGKDESQCFNWFKHIIADMRTYGGPNRHEWTAKYHANPLDGSTPEKRKPDLLLLDARLAASRGGSWALVRAVCEITREAGFHKRLMTMLAQRAALLLHNCPGRRFVALLVISGRQFMLSVYHRSGVSHSKRYDIVDNQNVFYHILAGFAYAKKEYLGYDPDITLDRLSQPRKIKFGTRKFIIKRFVCVREGIAGRGTICFDVMDPETQKHFLLKLVWVDESRSPNEIDMYLRMALHQITGVPVFLEYINCQWEEQKDTTKRWKPARATKFIERTYRKILLDGVGVPIYKFRTRLELFLAFEDIVKTHKLLHDKALILHRDLSLSNILLIDRYPRYPNQVKEDPEKQTEKRRRGFLIDFDYACFLIAIDAMYKRPEDVVRQRRVRTGTLPFMGIGVLLGFVENKGDIFYHTYQLDLESILYIMTWVGIHFCGPNGAGRDLTLEEPPEVYDDSSDIPTDIWMYPGKSWVTLGVLKGGTIAHFEELVLPWIHSYFSSYEKFLVDYVDTLFPDTMDKRHLKKRVMSPASYDDVLNLFKKYKEDVKNADITPLEYNMRRLSLDSVSELEDDADGADKE